MANALAFALALWSLGIYLSSSAKKRLNVRPDVVAAAAVIVIAVGGVGGIAFTIWAACTGPFFDPNMITGLGLLASSVAFVGAVADKHGS